MIKLMDNIKAIKGQVQSPSIPSYGANASEYFQLQEQLQ